MKKYSSFQAKGGDNLYTACIFADPGYTKDDERYIGAWWLGYLVLPIILLPISILLVWFPARMPEVEKKTDKTVEFNPDSEKGLNIFKGI